MFGHRYFGRRYFGPRYWGPGVDDVTTPDLRGCVHVSDRAMFSVASRDAAVTSVAGSDRAMFSVSATDTGC